MNRSPTGSMVGKTPYEAWVGSGKKPTSQHVCVLGSMAFVHVLKQKQKKLHDSATPGIFVGYSMSTKQYFVYDPLTKLLHRFQDVVFRGGMRYTALNAADKAILIEHFFSDVIIEPKPKSIEKQPTE
jgi:hypothetical protein